MCKCNPAAGSCKNKHGLSELTRINTDFVLKVGFFKKMMKQTEKMIFTVAFRQLGNEESVLIRLTCLSVGRSGHPCSLSEKEFCFQQDTTAFLRFSVSAYEGYFVERYQYQTAPITIMPGS